jgi:hypothetical protein
VAGIPDPVEFVVDFAAGPQPLAPLKPAVLDFAVLDPWKNRSVRKFVVVHEKLFHAFVVSADLEFFEHAHPAFDGDKFSFPMTFPKAGMFRILADFYPEGATPQLITKTIFVPGTAPAPAILQRDYSTKSDKNLTASLETIPQQPVVGQRTQLRFTLEPAEGLEKYLGAWAHMLAASDDVIDTMHRHPYIADGGPEMEFSVIFPRARTYRVWVQFQRQGIVNTVHFDIPIAPQSPDSEVSAAGAN